MNNYEFNSMEIPSEIEKHSLSDVVSSISETASEIYEKVEEGIKDYLQSTYEDIKEHKEFDIDLEKYKSYKDDYKELVLSAIEKEKNKNE